MDRFLHDAGVFFGHLASVNFGALAIALGFQTLRVIVRTRAWRNIIVAAYPDRQVRWRSVLGAYLAGVGLNAITPCAQRRRPSCTSSSTESGRTYPSRCCNARRGNAVDAAVGIAPSPGLSTPGALPNIHSLPDSPNIDLRRAFQHPLAPEIGALVLGRHRRAACGRSRVWCFWARVRQGFAILRDGEAYRAASSWQALSWWFASRRHRAACVPSSGDTTTRRSSRSRSSSTPLLITPGGATEQGLLLSVPRSPAQRAALLQRRHAYRDRRRNVVPGLLAIVLMTRTLRLSACASLPRRTQPRQLRLRTAASLRHPERPEVRDRVARTPPAQEPLNGRMEDDRVELVEREQAMASHGCVLGTHGFERTSREVACEDDVHDVLRGEHPVRRDRLDDAHRPLDRHVLVNAEPS
jgi:hypothetical protein